MPTSAQHTTIDEYIRTFPRSAQDTLEAVRGTVRAAVPDADETISYRMPAFKLNGHILLYFAAFKNHIGLYPPPPAALKKRVAPYEGPKGNLKFPMDRPIPLALVKSIAQHRAEEITARRATKK